MGRFRVYPGLDVLSFLNFLALMRSGVAFILRTQGGGLKEQDQDYREEAAECLSLARRLEQPNSKALFLQMAQAWLALGEVIKTRTDQS